MYVLYRSALTRKKLVLPSLKEISLVGNNIMKKSHYRAHLIFANKSLEIIDEKPVTDDEREKAEVTCFRYSFTEIKGPGERT